ncbi:glycosyltransferase [Methylosinus sporium]|uniref:Glycosyltransferase n=1 Tax=Methylosinus sporium TaxID=428 RepID=A0A549SWE1_METSR|nr:MULTISPECIES: ceramide glucosyltransferase [Methylosinus]MBU3888386.1 ceramide glucosyltransferase [Methylosinus sp. KRF6]TRL33946.1 glycosyltransferase [Methylosinus sporium]
MIMAYVCAAFCATLLTLNLSSIAIAAFRCKARPRNLRVPAHAPPVSIVRPLRGLETFSEETLGSTFALDYPRYEVLFCVQCANDPVIPLVERMIAAHPQISARLLVGDDYVSVNPKLNNCVKGWDAARYAWVVLADSNALLPPDYIQTMLAAFRDDTALSISMPIGSRPKGFWAEVECAFLNTFQARWQYGAEAVGIGFAQGKNMMWRREVLERAGGIRALGAEIAEDAASTKIIRAQKMKVRLVDMPFEQPLGHRTAHEVYSRHVRWARLRRVTFPAYFAPEFMNGSFMPVVTGAYAAHLLDANVALTAAAILAGLYGAECLLARIAGWRLSRLTPLALLTRDILLPVMFVDACLFDDFVWHGNAMTVREQEEQTTG